MEENSQLPDWLSAGDEMTGGGKKEVE